MVLLLKSIVEFKFALIAISVCEIFAPTAMITPAFCASRPVDGPVTLQPTALIKPPLLAESPDPDPLAEVTVTDFPTKILPPVLAEHPQLLSSVHVIAPALMIPPVSAENPV
jgi:hypothetical protein